ncbi:MAG: hypothetical protein ACK4VO_04685 [Pseudobdellovibrio sp.]
MKTLIRFYTILFVFALFGHSLTQAQDIAADSNSNSGQGEIIESYTPTVGDAVNVSEVSDVQVIYDRPLMKVHLGVIGQNFVYREPDIDITDSGRLTGLEAMLQYSLKLDLYLRGHMQFLTGNLKYDGHLMNSNAAYETNNDYKIREFKGDVSIKTDLSQDTDIFFYVGLGRKETLQANNPNEKADYARDITYNYYSLGSFVNVVVNEQMNLVFDASFESLLSGGVYTHLSDVSSSYEDVNLKFISGNSIGGDINLNYRVTSSDTLTAKLGMRRWIVDRSEYTYSKQENAYFYEPKNTTQITTLGLGYLF